VFDKLLLCVGAQKAGTSWLHKALSRSDRIEFSPYKEVHYFDTCAGLTSQLPMRILSGTARQFGYSRKLFLERLPVTEKKAIAAIRSMLDDQWYLSQFRHDREYCADFTPEYALLGKRELQGITRLARQLKVIFIMRDPVERSLSAFRYYHQNRDIDLDSIPDAKTLKLLKTHLFAGRSDYPSVIEKLDKTFAQEDVLYLFYEDLMRDKPGGLGQVCEFLEIPVLDLPERALNKKINKTTPHTFSAEVRQNLASQYEKDKRTIHRRFGRLPAEW